MHFNPINYITWSNLDFAFSGVIAKSAPLVSLLGYAVIMSDPISKNFSMENFFSEEVSLYFNANQRISLLFVGLSLITFACIFHHFFKPEALKLSSKRNEYISIGVQTFGDQIFDGIATDIIENRYNIRNEWEGYYGRGMHGSISIESVKAPSSPPVNLQDKNNVKISALETKFLAQDKSRIAPLIVCVAILFTGYFLILLPSFDVFLAAVKQIF